jgi:hypothetical protein
VSQLMGLPLFEWRRSPGGFGQLPGCDLKPDEEMEAGAWDSSRRNVPSVQRARFHRTRSSFRQRRGDVLAREADGGPQPFLLSHTEATKDTEGEGDQ